MKYGVRNSLLTAVMPTASTSQIMGNNECIEPYTTNVYTRRTIAGEFTVVNTHLMEDLISLNMWNEEIRDRLLYNRGSVQNIPNLPTYLKEVYKTVWEISQKDCIDMAADRGRFICQSQSLNLWFAQPDFKTLTNAHMYGWKQGLKTGSYYIRSKPARNSQRFTMDPSKEKKFKEEEAEECLSCGS
jgi:ribonucleoside-diphosphate reductase alpha chain